MTITRNNTFSRQLQQSNIDYGYHTPAELEIKQNEKQIQEKKRYRRQKRLLPKRFIYRPRVPSGTARIPLDSDVPQAIDALVENDQYQGKKIYMFLQDTANIAIQRVKMNILSSITDNNNTETLLSTPWRLIPKENKKMAIQYLMRRALRHKKRIRLDLCQKNWITEHLLSECWNKNVVPRNMVTDNHQCQKQKEEQQELPQQYITESNNYNEREDDWNDLVLETEEKYFALYYNHQLQSAVTTSSKSSSNSNTEKLTKSDKVPVVIPASPSDSICEPFSYDDTSSCSSPKSVLPNLSNRLFTLPENFDVTVLSFYPNNKASSSDGEK